MLPLGYALRNLWRRRMRTILTLVGIALISVLVVLMIGFARGLAATARGTASPDVLVLTGSASEHDLVRSVVARNDAEAVAAKLPGVVSISGMRAAVSYTHLRAHET